ncbi:MAG: glycogen-binding domain-containing protein [Saprospiraceae bacterium]|nr:glycogen-binding domain-containing protein [Saprospiraceae bacterium]
MRKFWKYRILVFLFLPLAGLMEISAQNPAYHFEGDDVVFIFDIRDYQYALQEGKSEYLDFSDLDIYDVAISGSFNDWSDRGWRMKKKNKYVFELRKHVSDFSDVLDWDFKYIINGKHIINQALSFKDHLFDNDFIKEVFGIEETLIKIHKDGAVRFFLDGHPQAQNVILTGSFNNWNEKDLLMEKVSGGWELRCDLPPGRYEYKFIIDGQWTHDLNNPDKKRNEYATFNSILDITIPITFELGGFESAKEVILAGSFNDWDEHKTTMQHSDGKWQVAVPLSGGKHYYKFIVDGRWYVDPANPVWEKDNRGNVNSVLFVR